MRRLAFFLAVLMPGMGWAWEEPQRGTDTRSALMDALRPHAEWMLGKPVEFVVHSLRRSGDVGFASVRAQRPGGGMIEIARTPGAKRGQLDAEFMDGSSLQALYRKSGKTWVAVHWAIGATDVWYADPAFCPEYQAVIPEVCGG
ncbi:hypothetical protein FDP25_12050 [Roseovarius sp. A21]|uniref:Uncharacterized protein n=1 Tax=Roseovarius bejariae TaxID=2576383 RepID=A0A844D1R7_9RHOB|nr:hypothetical protein [Roseovarius bejariae]MRU16164.1 hypothetical protein [Roseovarius bejariae]